MKRAGNLIQLFGIVWVVIYSTSLALHAAEPSARLQEWLTGQAQLKQWSAELTQTRTLKSLSEPLTESGRVYFSAPNLFRWELGQPAKTIAVREKNQMLVVYPRLKRAEKYPLATVQTGPWKDALMLLEAGFPRSAQELNEKFRLLAEEPHADRHVVKLEPRSSSARRMMPLIQIEFSPQSNHLLATELKFADGSTLRNDFKSAQLNPALSADLFTAPIAADFKIVEPGQKK